MPSSGLSKNYSHIHTPLYGKGKRNMKESLDSLFKEVGLLLFNVRGNVLRDLGHFHLQFSCEHHTPLKREVYLLLIDSPLVLL